MGPTLPGPDHQTPSLESIPTEDFLRLLGLKVRSYRKRAGITRRQLAHKSGVSERYLANVELGIGNISIGLLKQITDALQIPISKVFAIDIPPGLSVEENTSPI